MENKKIHVINEKTGESSEVSEIKNIGVESVEGLSGAISAAGEVAFSASITISRLAHTSLLLGRMLTNNWLKMHGGVMEREQAYWKAKKGISHEQK